jgi:hypothetical protein
MSDKPPTQEENRPDVTSDQQDAKKGFDHRTSSDNGGGKFDYRLESDMYDDNDDGMNQNLGIELGYLPPEQRPGIPGELLAQLVDPDIDDDTEAAEALRANANVKVGKVGKVARSLNAQSVRKLVKRATLRGQSGNKRGKPPRIPPGITSAATDDEGQGTMFPVEGSESYVDAEDDFNSTGEMMPYGVNGGDGFLKDNHAKKQDSSDSYQRQNQHAIAVHETEGKSKKERQSNIDERKDIPEEVVAATMETGRKRKSFVWKWVSHFGTPTNFVFNVVMGAIDPHNMLQLQRWRRKNKKGKKKKRKSYVKGKVIDGRHELYTLSIAVMLGVRTSIAKTNTIIANTTRANALTAQDFMAEEKYEFAPKVSTNLCENVLDAAFSYFLFHISGFGNNSTTQIVSHIQI